MAINVPESAIARAINRVLAAERDAADAIAAAEREADAVIDAARAEAESAAALEAPFETSFVGEEIDSTLVDTPESRD